MTDVFKPVRPGDRAPAFALAAANRDGTVSLGDYQPKRAVLLGLFRGLHCSAAARSSSSGRCNRPSPRSAWRRSPS